MSTINAANVIATQISANTVTRQGVEIYPALEDENKIINGAMDFWQRGTSNTGLGFFTVDRFFNGYVGGTITMSRQSFAVGDALGKNSPKYYLRQTVSGHSLASHESRIGQHIESVASYAGQTITVLGWARRSSGTGNMALDCVQYFGSGGSPSTEVTNIGVNSITLTGSWAPFAAVVPVPSISGKTLGTDGNDRLTITFWTSAGSNFNSRTNSLGLQTIGVDLWGVHIRHGVHTTDSVNAYVAPDLASELAKCQRYYVSGLGFYGGTYTASATNVRVGTCYFPVTMRITPSLATSNVGYGTSSGLTTEHVDNGKFGFYILSTGATYPSVQGYVALDAEL